MKYFEKDYINFFKDLSKNNHKEWFHANKKRYETSVKNPFLNFVGDLITEIQKTDKTIQVEAKNCIGRINRDIRFAKDKTPYNLHMTAFISPLGKKDKSQPGIYLRFSPEMLGIMGGCFGPDKTQLANLRKAIIKNPKEINKLISSKKFKDAFGDIKGDVMKRIPKDLQAAVEKEPLILHKQFYYVKEEKPTLITSPDLMKQILKYHKIMLPVNEFLTKAIKK